MNAMDRPFDEIQILVVDDEKSIRRLAQKELASPRRRITTAATVREAQDLMRQQTFDVDVLDMRLPDGDGLGLLLKIKETDSSVEVIMVTGYADIESAVEAMKMGAYDFLAKPFNLDRLEILIERAFQRVSLERENRLLRHSQTTVAPGKLIGHSSEMEQVRFLITKVAPTPVPVLITGESGTGKNVVARSIHRLSPRSEHLLVTKNCGTLEKNLIRSELFGHRKGAFTGAHENRDGLLAVAHKGTLFLDEIGELSLEVQSALLRVLENQTFRRVGDKDERRVDIRFIFATNRCLTEEVQSGRFSQALFHRLNVFNISLPPLKDRKEDIPALVEYFLVRLCPGGSHCRISQKAMQCLLGYNWPGNVRELQNVIERGIILAENHLITELSLPRELVDAGREGPVDAPFLALDDLQRRHILRVMKFVDGSRGQAAEILGIGRKTLYRKLKEIDGAGEALGGQGPGAGFGGSAAQKAGRSK